MDGPSPETGIQQNIANNQLKKTEKVISPELTVGERSVDKVSDYIENSRLNNSEYVENLIQNGSYENFKVHLVRLNALFRGLTPEEHTLDGESVRIFDNLVPISAELKEEVLKSTFDSLKMMPPKDRGVLMYNMLGALHLFGDGNGRSMRIWHHILSGEKIGNDSVTKLIVHDDPKSDMSKSGRKEIQSFLNSNTYHTSGIINRVSFASEMNELGVTDIRAALPYLTPILSEETIRELPIKDINRLNNISNNDTGASYCQFNILTMFMLSREDKTFKTPLVEITNNIYKYDTEQTNDVEFTAQQVSRFLQINDELKMRHLKTMIDIFENPQNHKYSNGDYIKSDFYSPQNVNKK